MTDHRARAGLAAHDGEGAPAERADDVGAYYTDPQVARFLARRGLWEALRTHLERDVERGRAPDGLARHGLPRPHGDGDADGRWGFDALADRYADEPAVLAHVDGVLRDLTVCDPAAGDGALLLAAAETLWEWRSRCGDHDPAALRRGILSANLFGVDCRAAAAEACRRRLRAWALDVAPDGSPESDPRPPVPDPAVRTGNSLLGTVDPGLLAETRRDPEATAPGAVDTGRDELRPRLDAAYAARQRARDDGPRMADHVADADAAWSSLLAAPGPAVLRVTVPEGLPEDIAAALDEHGFTTYTYTARLEDPALDTSTTDDPSIDKHGLERVFERLREGPDDWTVVVERAYVGRDFAPDALDALHWPLAFPSAFREGGFDLVLGNPPYGASLPPEAEPLVTDETNYECQGASDSCEWFYERALALARDGGVVSYVVTKALAFYASWSDIREKLLDETAIRHVFDVGLGFADVDLETVALVHTLDGARVEHGGSEANVTAVYHSENRRRRDANRPVYRGSVDQRVMCDAGTVVFSPLDDDQRAALDRIRGCDRRLGDLMSTAETTRQLYVPDSEKRTLGPGDDAYVESNPWVQPFHLTDVWHCDLDAYRESVRTYAVPRVMLKVLRGSRLRAWLDPHGELVGTEKLVSVPLTASSPAEIAVVYAALNHPCASFYLQTAVFSGTTETARVMDGHYARPIPVPDPPPAVEAAVAGLAWTLTLARQVAYDTERDLDRACDCLGRALEALVGGLYLDFPDTVRAWSDELLADGPPTDRLRRLFEAFYTERYATRDGNPDRYRDDIESLARQTVTVVDGWDTGRICKSSEMTTVQERL